MTSTKKIYGYVAELALIAFGLLAWNVQGYANNTTLGRIGKETATNAGLAQPTIDLGGGPASQEYTGRVINHDATSFIHLSNSVLQVLTWALLIGIAALVLLAVVMKSWQYALAPGAAFLVGNIIIGEGQFNFGETGSVAHMMTSVFVVTLIGVACVLLNVRYNIAPSRSVPDTIPAEMSAQQRTSGDRH
ncbi:MAG: hypothetical protein Q7T74_01125 [Candidatus Saccharibacteria bacterium]|nr:hypothetical protein [Candidatus Saccharibacteria bacterium]